jgi:hypothetical protein
VAARANRPGPRKRRQRGRKQEEHRLSLRRLQRLLSTVARRGHGLHLRLFPRLERQPRRGAGEQARHGLPQAAAEARRVDARHRQRLGLARLSRCAVTLRVITASMSSA